MPSLDLSQYGPLVGALAIAIGWLVKENRRLASELTALHAQWRADLKAASQAIKEVITATTPRD